MVISEGWSLNYAVFAWSNRQTNHQQAVSCRCDKLCLSLLHDKAFQSFKDEEEVEETGGTEELSLDSS